MKKLLSKILFVGTAGLALAACGATTTDSSSDSASTASSTAATANVLKTIEENKQLRIGVEGTYPPFSYHDTETGDLVGFEVEIAEGTKVRIVRSFIAEVRVKGEPVKAE